MLSEDRIAQIELEIYEQQKTVDFDTKEFTIELLVNKYLIGIDEDENDIYVPEYQREFVWSEVGQSTLIESIVLGLPIPVIFLAENSDGRLEIVDGSQRIRTIVSFISNNLSLVGLKKLKNLNKVTFSDLPKARQRKILNTAIRMIVLSESANEEVKNDLFERINKGSDLLRHMERRKGSHPGKFTEFIYEYARQKKLILNKIAPLSKTVEKRQEHEELLLRFLALVDNYPDYPKFSYSITSTLDEYIESKNKTVTVKEISEKTKRLDEMLEFVDNNFINGFSSKEGYVISRMFFEALSVGVAKTLFENPDFNLTKKIDPGIWLSTPEFKSLISGKHRTHSPECIKKRINFVKNKLLSL